MTDRSASKTSSRHPNQRARASGAASRACLPRERERKTRALSFCSFFVIRICLCLGHRFVRDFWLFAVGLYQIDHSHSHRLLPVVVEAKDGGAGRGAVFESGGSPGTNARASAPRTGSGERAYHRVGGRRSWRALNGLQCHIFCALVVEHLKKVLCLGVKSFSMRWGSVVSRFPDSPDSPSKTAGPF